MAKSLNYNEFMEILKGIDYDDQFEDNGSSRMVFQINYEGHNCVLKLAGGLAGLTQTEYEIYLHETANEELADSLATIYAYYKNIAVIMEYTEEYDTFSFYLEDEEVADMWRQKKIDLREKLDDIIGNSGDNEQIGYSSEYNKLVIYDYGYCLGCDFVDQVGNLGEYGTWELQKILEYIQDNLQADNTEEVYKYIDYKLDLGEDAEYGELDDVEDVE